jgi:hypothetical protein
MNPTFNETQRFNKWWHYLIAGVPVLLIITVFLLTLTGIIPSKNEENTAHLGLITTFGIGSTFVFFIWFILLKLNTTISESGITAHFFGIPFFKKHIDWNDIQNIAVIEYSPISEYGGWGVRWSFNGWCYNVSGKIGIKIIQKNGKPFLIGTQQKEEAQSVINHYFKK